METEAEITKPITGRGPFGPGMLTRVTEQPVEPVCEEPTRYAKPPASTDDDAAVLMARIAPIALAVTRSVDAGRVVGMGTAAVSLSRCKRVLSARRGFAKRIVGPQESVPATAAALGRRIAVKNAVIAALGGGRWTEITVRHDWMGTPAVELHGATAKLAPADDLYRLFLSVSDDVSNAAAIALVIRA